MQRREFLALGAGLTSSLVLGTAQADETPQDVAWLADVTRPPQKIPQPDRPLAPLLIDGNGQPLTTWKDWEAERKRIRQKWLDFLGPMPKERPEIKLEILGQPDPNESGIKRHLVRYQTEAGEFVEGYLLRPFTEKGKRMPAIVALHSTSPASIDDIASTSNSTETDQGLADLLCHSGYVVFCPRCYLWQTPPAYKLDVKTTVDRFRQRHPKTLGMHKMLFDAQRAVDVLSSLPEVDPKRISAVGHSLGAKEVLYLTAFDDRVRTGVFSEGGIAFGSTNWHDPWYLGVGINVPDFKLNHHQLLALIAPRPFLVFGGESGPGAADGDRSWPHLAAAQDVYRLSGETIRLGMLNHHQGHHLSWPVQNKMLEWLRTYTA
jgi:dienelactone hydrolase